MINKLQLNLTFDGKLIDEELMIDGELINTENCVDLSELVNSIFDSGEFFILTCDCGEAGCTGLHKGILVKHVQHTICWTMIVHDNQKEFVFDRQQYKQTIQQFFKAADAIKEGVYMDFNIGPTTFGPAEFEACKNKLQG